jgi:hypothetical protein
MKVAGIINCLLLLGFSALYASDTVKSDCRVCKNQFHLKLGASYNFSANNIRLEVGILRNDYPFSLHRHGEWSEIINHHAFISTEINLDHHFFMGPKIGYEFNYVFLQGRMNVIDYLDFKGQNDAVVRPELGITLFGLYSVAYGYNVRIKNPAGSLVETHNLTFVFNKF